MPTSPSTGQFPTAPWRAAENAPPQQIEEVASPFLSPTSATKSALSGHVEMPNGCPLLRAKRTSSEPGLTSSVDSRPQTILRLASATRQRRVSGPFYLVLLAPLLRAIASQSRYHSQRQASGWQHWRGVWQDLRSFSLQKKRPMNLIKSHNN